MELWRFTKNRFISREISCYQGI